MSRYLDIAAKITPLAKQLLEMVDESDRPDAAELIARIVNLGIRCSPRGVQHTVRLNAVRAAVRDLPVKVGMVEKKDERTGRAYNALTTEPIRPMTVGTPGLPTVEGPIEE